MRSLLFVFCLAVAGVLMAPAFLLYSSPVETVDCVIMLVGGEPGAREQGAASLVEQGRAGALLVPGRQKAVLKPMLEGGRTARPGNAEILPETMVAGLRWRLFGRSWRLFENTHLELLTGRKMMEKLGYHSAVLVSSPYHMRRLQLIAARVFSDDYHISFAATPFETYDLIGCYSSWRNFAKVAGEYLKIGWFLIYSWFV
ncbi:MAG: YdcF family protein [Deltaproteobacteria bacterium]|nr:YdcF family protein [Deltaproteobacteria bacterium]